MAVLCVCVCVCVCVRARVTQQGVSVEQKKIGERRDDVIVL